MNKKINNNLYSKFKCCTFQTIHTQYFQGNFYYINFTTITNTISYILYNKNYIIGNSFYAKNIYIFNITITPFMFVKI